MAWISISENNIQLPAEHEYVEVQLKNGTVQMAYCLGGTFHVPGSENFPTPEAGILDNVQKWRLLSETNAGKPVPHFHRFD